MPTANPVDIYENPTREAIESTVESALKQNKLFTLYARIEAEYTGRDAGGYLSVGDCMVMVKPDGTMLVHSDTNHRPENWQTSGTTIFLDETDAGELTLNGRQSDENLMVVLHDVYTLTAYNTEKKPSLELEGTEDDMHEYLLENPGEIEEGFRPATHEQSEISGRIDIFGYDENGTPVLVEVKRRQASHKHVDQLNRYVKRYREQHPDDDAVRGILVAPSTSDNVNQMLNENNLEFVELNPFDTPTAHPQNSSLNDF